MPEFIFNFFVSGTIYIDIIIRECSKWPDTLWAEALKSREYREILWENHTECHYLSVSQSDHSTVFRMGYIMGYMSPLKNGVHGGTFIGLGYIRVQNLYPKPRRFFPVLY